MRSRYDFLISLLCLALFHTQQDGFLVDHQTKSVRVFKNPSAHLLHLLYLFEHNTQCHENSPAPNQHLFSGGLKCDKWLISTDG